MGQIEPNGRNAFFRYLTCSEEDEKWQLVCTDAGYSEVPPHTRYPPNKEGHPQAFKSVAVGRTLVEYQIVYITKGRGVFETSQKTHVVVPGTVMMIFPGIRHHYKPGLRRRVDRVLGRIQGPPRGHAAGSGFPLAPEAHLRSGTSEQPSRTSMEGSSSS